MASENKTVIEIVNDMRQRAAVARRQDADATIHHHAVGDMLAYLANQVEAAHNREILVERHLADEHLAEKDAEIARLRTLTTRTDNSEVTVFYSAPVSGGGANLCAVWLSQTEGPRLERQVAEEDSPRASAERKQKMKPSEMTNEELAKNAEEFANAFHNESDKAILREAAARLRRNCKRCQIESIDREAEVNTLRAKLKVAEDALEAASDAFRFCIEQCELELGPRMIGKLCDDGKAVERALAAIHGEGGNDAH